MYVYSASDRYKYIRETAFEYAFVLDQIAPSSTTAPTTTAATQSSIQGTAAAATAKAV